MQLSIFLTKKVRDNMKATILGCRRQKGISAKTNNPYDMCQLILQVPIEQVSNDKIQISGAGYETAVLPFDPEKESIFVSLKYPLVADIVTDSIPRFGQYETIAIGIRSPS